jgi:CubicO group peptidase (beta-lactamase class C family)
MNKLKLLLSAVLIVIFISSCFNNSTISTTDIEGLWISTEETSSQFAPGADKVALQIRRDSTRTLTAHGFFLKNDEFKEEWEFINVQYDTIAKRISLLDSDSDTLICCLDAKNEILKGAGHSQDNTKKPLNFIRADKNLEIRLFYPRIPDKNGKITYSYKIPEQIDDGLQTESIYRYSTDSSSIPNLMKEVIDQKYGSIKSLLILKNSKLIVEEYFYGYNRDDLQQIRSCTKSVTSLLFGIALDHHKDIDIEQPIFNFFPEYGPLKTEEKEEITLKNVLTMTAGLEWDDYPPEMYKTDDCFQYILSRPMACKPGEKFEYNSGCSVLLGGIIQFLEAKKTLAFAKEFLFTPMGITNYIWESHKNDILRCGEGLSLRPRDMAKIGLLVLNDGKWQDKQVVSKEWIRESTKPHVPESKFFDYGYQWWHHSKNNLQWWKEPNAVSPKEHDLITALGHGGQYIMIIRDLNLVIVTTASDFDNGHIARSKIPMVIEEIVPIFEDSKL